MKLNKKLALLNESATIALNTEVQNLKRKGVDVLNLTAGELDFETPKEIQEYVIGQIHRNKYTPTLGLSELRERVASYAVKEYLWPARAENVAITTGAKQALHTLFQVILNSGDEVIIPTPTWVSYEYQILLASGKPVFVPLKKNFDLDIAAIKKALTPRTKAIVINSPHNPTGAVFSETSLRALGRLLKNTDVFIISDNIYNTLTYISKQKPIISFIQDIERVILINGFSKSHALTGWRIGYMVADKSIIEGVNKIQSHASGNTAVMSQLAALGSFNYHITEPFLKTLKHRKTVGEKILKKISKISFHSPAGAFYFFIDIKKIEKNSAYFCEQLLKHKQVAIVPGEAFHAPGFIRISFACEEKILREALLRLSTFIQEYPETTRS